MNQISTPVVQPCNLRLSLPGFQPFAFAFPCATLITVLMVFIMYMTVRSATHQKDMVEVGTLLDGGENTEPFPGEGTESWLSWGELISHLTHLLSTELSAPDGAAEGGSQGGGN